MDDAEVELAHPGQQRRRRRRGGHHRPSPAARGGAPGWLMTISWTVGAPLKCVTPSASISSQTSVGVDLADRHVPAATAVTAQGKHQPLQWNIGSVHR